MAKFQRIQDLREDRDLRQEGIAKILEITRQQYQLYESGKREIKFSLAIKLAQYYDVSLDYTAGLTNEKPARYILAVGPTKLVRNRKGAAKGRLITK